MELRHLRYFVAVAEELNFGRAARRLSMSQPPLSKQIQQLEEAVGAQLLARDNRRVELTDAGRAFLDDAREILGRVDSALERSRDAASRATGRLVVAIEPGCHATHSLPRIVAQLRERYADLALELADLAPAAQAEALLERRISVGFVFSFTKCRDLVDEVVESVPLVALLPESHPVARERTVASRRLAGASFVAVARSASPGTSDALRERAQEAGLAMRVVQEVPHPSLLASLVAAKVGIALAPEATPLPRGVVSVPLLDARPLELRLLACRRDPSPLAGRVLRVSREVAREVARELGQDAREPAARAPRRRAPRA